MAAAVPDWKLVRSEGENKDLLFLVGKRTTETTIQVTNLTGATVLLYIRRNGQTANLSEFDGLDISASISDAVNGLIDHTPTAPQIAELVTGEYTWNLKVTESDGTETIVPSDLIEQTKVEFGLLSVYANLT